MPEGGEMTGGDPQVAVDFNAAIDRLVAGKPNDVLLKQKAARGKLKLNFSTVAQEAHRSRTLIAIPSEEELVGTPVAQRPRSTCAYPEIRKRILALMNPVVSPSDSNAVIARLRSDNRELQSKLQNALDQAREHLTARQVAERDRDRWRDSYQRLFDKQKQESGTNVLPFRPLAAEE